MKGVARQTAPSTASAVFRLICEESVMLHIQPFVSKMSQCENN